MPLAVVLGVLSVCLIFLIVGIAETLIDKINKYKSVSFVLLQTAFICGVFWVYLSVSTCTDDLKYVVTTEKLYPIEVNGINLHVFKTGEGATDFKLYSGNTIEGKEYDIEIKTGKAFFHRGLYYDSHVNDQEYALIETGNVINE